MNNISYFNKPLPSEILLILVLVKDNESIMYQHCISHVSYNTMINTITVELDKSVHDTKGMIQQR